MTETNRWVRAYQNDNVPFVVNQGIWMEGETKFADIILPVSTKYEERDIGSDTSSYLYDAVFIQDKCIEPLGESMSDYEIVCAIAEKLGLLKEYTKGKSVEDWIKNGFDQCGVPEAGLMGWEEFKEKGYYVVPTDPGWKKHRAGMIEFYEDPAKDRLQTPSGKIEFYSQNLAKHFAADKERPPVPHWVEKGESHDERLSGERAKTK